VKGIVNGEDAKHAIERGADGVSVSNHGGIQLDGAPSTIATLREVVDAVDGRAEVLLDGGVRSGQDVLKAVALGATACLIGRVPLYGLAANGEAGVRQAINIIREEIDITIYCYCHYQFMLPRILLAPRNLRSCRIVLQRPDYFHSSV
jgi:L-lactate dehydrogenase (cytochrome)